VSNYENPHDIDDPRYEPWLGVMTSAFVPLIISLYSPSRYIVPLIAITVVLFAAGLIMLRRQTIRRARERGEAQMPSVKSTARSSDDDALEIQGVES
jgi:hypothetical protein